METTSGERFQSPLPLGKVLRHAVAAAGALVDEHVKMASAELEKDATGLSRDVSHLLISVPVLAAGYLLSCGAAVAALAPGLGVMWSAAVVGAGNLFAGLALGGAALNRLQSRTWLVHTRAQLRRSLETVVTALDEDLSTPTPGPS